VSVAMTCPFAGRVSLITALPGSSDTIISDTIAPLATEGVVGVILDVSLDSAIVSVSAVTSEHQGAVFTAIHGIMELDIWMDCRVNGDTSHKHPDRSNKTKDWY